MMRQEESQTFVTSDLLFAGALDLDQSKNSLFDMKLNWGKSIVCTLIPRSSLLFFDESPADWALCEALL